MIVFNSVFLFRYPASRIFSLHALSNSLLKSCPIFLWLYACFCFVVYLCFKVDFITICEWVEFFTRNYFFWGRSIVLILRIKNYTTMIYLFQKCQFLNAYLRSRARGFKVWKSQKKSWKSLWSLTRQALGPLLVLCDFRKDSSLYLDWCWKEFLHLELNFFFISFLFF